MQRILPKAEKIIYEKKRNKLKTNIVEITGSKALANPNNP